VFGSESKLSLEEFPGQKWLSGRITYPYYSLAWLQDARENGTNMISALFLLLIIFTALLFGNEFSVGFLFIRR
jgi:hypothetical protein